MGCLPPILKSIRKLSWFIRKEKKGISKLTLQGIIASYFHGSGI
jgi:hypothetical protein